jgi:hypothetical protein
MSGEKKQRAEDMRRMSFTLCHEASHFLMEEQQERVNLGLPHTALNDIINDWIIAQGKRCGHKKYRERER